MSGAPTHPNPVSCVHVFHAHKKMDLIPCSPCMCTQKHERKLPRLRQRWRGQLLQQSSKSLSHLLGVAQSPDAARG
jgi:hypothetical protein